MNLLVIALAFILGGGAAALLASHRAGASSACAVLGILAGGIVGEVHAWKVLLHGETSTLTMAWSVPYGRFHIGVDPLSAFFLVPIFGLSVVTAIYGREYLRNGRGRSIGGARFAWPAFNLLVASMVLVVVARHALLFLFAWEAMSLSAYVLVTLEHHESEVRRAGWVYLIATHIGTACLVALFLLLGKSVQGFDLVPGTHPTASALLFGLAVVGFGVKAGFVPFHVWLPEAHAAAPSHVSALMSGVMIKMGFYGLLRMVLVLGPPSAWWGPVLMIIGFLGALLGISLAFYQRDLKRVLAYSSVENMGLITLGMGTGLWGLTSGRPHVAVLGVSSALLHVWNHTLMKGLMFLGAGSILHGCHTKDLEQLGGLMKRMPKTSIAMVVGAMAMAGLPPLNGFVSEWLLYLGLIEGAVTSRGASGVAGLLSVGLVALVGGLAMICFVRLIGIALLGQPRSAHAQDAHESAASMTVPLLLLALTCIGVGLGPRIVVQAGASVVGQLLGGPSMLGETPLAGLGLANGALWLALLVGAALGWWVTRRRSIGADATWGCGYAAPSSRMQYTSRSFAELMGEHLLPKMLRARVSVETHAALFPESGKLASQCDDPLTRGVYEPFLARWGDRFARLRWLQQGHLHVYLVYILIATLLALAWISLLTWSGR
ncbi:oxidoreductase [Pendulispora brunnea]|uniref:Oxidoreductase n=1 Tax=Pendulispora brunnea TaxID=2905690 RepID=A0ABZ2K5S1_9BACT